MTDIRTGFMCRSRARWPGPGNLANVFPLITALIATGCGAGPEKPLNVVMITIDTLRADHLGAYGSPRPTSPNLDAFARDSVTFDHNWAQAPCTYPSVNSLLTSRYPAHLVEGRKPGDLGIPDDVPTLAEMLRARGYSTHAVSASPIVRASPSENNRTGGFGRGFDTYDEACLWNNVQCVNHYAMQVLDRVAEGRKRATASGAEAPFFLYLQYMDAHDPYLTPDNFQRPFSGEYTGIHDWVAKGDPNPLAKMIYGGGARVDFDEADIEFLKARYDDGIAYFDAGITALFDELEEKGLLDETLVVILSDHGESFMEHGHIEHCYNLFEHNLHTPLMIRVPGNGFRHRVSAQTSNLDLAPTILDFVDERLPESVVADASSLSLRIQGRSLRPLIEAGPADESAETDRNLSFASIGRYRAVTDGDFKLIEDVRSGTRLLFDLAADPGETTNLAGDDRPELRRLLVALHKWMDSEEGSDRSRPETEAALRQLRALGYLQ